MQGYRISTKKEEMDFEFIHAYISRSYWASGIPRDIMARAMENSICFGVFKDEGEQVGFARVISDKASFAYLADVFIIEEERGRGLSKWLLQTILAHEDLQGLRRFNLATRDAHGLYAQYGFKPLANPDYHMEVSRPKIYQEATRLDPGTETQTAPTEKST